MDSSGGVQYPTEGHCPEGGGGTCPEGGASRFEIPRLDRCLAPPFLAGPSPSPRTTSSPCPPSQTSPRSADGCTYGNWETLTAFNKDGSKAYNGKEFESSFFQAVFQAVHFFAGFLGNAVNFRVCCFQKVCSKMQEISPFFGAKHSVTFSFLPLPPNLVNTPTHICGQSPAHRQASTHSYAPTHI